MEVPTGTCNAVACQHRERGTACRVGSDMFAHFDEAQIQTSEMSIFMRRDGTDRPLLLHGFPQTNLMWRDLASVASISSRFKLERRRPCNEFRNEAGAPPVIGNEVLPRRPAIPGRDRRGDGVRLRLDRIEQLAFVTLIRLHPFDERM